MINQKIADETIHTVYNMKSSDMIEIKTTKLGLVKSSRLHVPHRHCMLCALSSAHCLHNRKSKLLLDVPPREHFGNNKQFALLYHKMITLDLKML